MCVLPRTHRGNHECGSAQPSLLLYSDSYVLTGMLKSSADRVCQLEADPGMSGQPEARPLQRGLEGEDSLIKNCLDSSSLGPSHPHTLACMAKSGH
jgi:hypothetical protein